MKKKDDGSNVKEGILETNLLFQAKKNYKWLLFSLMIAIFPSATFWSRKASGVLFFSFLALILLSYLHERNISYSFGNFFKEYGPVFIVSFAFPLSEILTQIFISEINTTQLKFLFRFALIPFFVYGLLRFPYKNLRHIRYGFFISVIVCSISYFYFCLIEGQPRPQTQIYTGIYLITFVNMNLLCGFLCFFSIDLKKEKRLFTILKVLALIIAVVVSVRSETRGGWLMIPFFIWFCMLFFKMKGKKKLIFLLAALIMLSGVSFFNETVQSRLSEITHEMGSYYDGNRDTSVGIRMQYYKAGIAIFKQSPVFGVGVEHFMGKMEELLSEGVISKSAYDIGGHLHNEALYRLARTGILGALSVVSLMLVPFFYFYRSIKSDDSELRSVACKGAVFTLSFFVFGLTDAVFVWKQIISYYAIILSILLALLIKRKREIGEGASFHDAG